MQYTPNFNFLIPEGTDTVNLLTQCYPNFTSLDTILQAIKESGTTEAVTTKTGTVHAIVRNVADCNVIRWVNTANYVAGDTFTVDGTPVTATAMDGTALPGGAFVINQSSMAILNGTVLTFVGVPGVSSVAANDVTYDNTGSGLTAADVQDAIDELAARPVVAAAEDITYDNTVSGLTATDVQAAIDELKALIPATPTYITTGLSIVSNRCSIIAGGYYIDNGYVYVDITIMALTSLGGGSAFITGFPDATSFNATSPNNINTIFNGVAITKSSAVTPVNLGACTSITSGQTVHYIGSYQMA